MITPFLEKALPLYGKAALLTLRIGWIGILFSVVIGLAVALIRFYRVPVLAAVCRVYIEISRNTPLLVQLFFLYFGLPKIGVSVSPEFCGAAGLAFLGAGYMAEAFRSGLESVDKIQHESAASLGLTNAQAMRCVILPQAVSVSVPAFMANIIFLLKETSVFSAVSLMDLMFTARDLIAMRGDTLEALTLLVVFYLLILLPVSIIGSIAERRVRRAGFGS